MVGYSESVTRTTGMNTRVVERRGISATWRVQPLWVFELLAFVPLAPVLFARSCCLSSVLSVPLLFNPLREKLNGGGTPPSLAGEDA
jgi:hypothetical protein